jgi:hypothetical protein
MDLSTLVVTMEKLDKTKGIEKVAEEQREKIAAATAAKIDPTLTANRYAAPGKP